MFSRIRLQSVIGNNVKLLSALVLALLLSACASTPTAPTGADGKAKTVEQGSIVTIIPMDIELSLLTASGMQEPKAEWTEKASALMSAELDRALTAAGYQVSKLDRATDDPNQDYTQIQKLNETVGFTIAAHHYGIPLPSKEGRLDWSIGESAQLLKGSQDSKYALYVYFRDSYSSTGRVAIQVLGALAGFVPAGGQQVGFASLVDTESGDIVWYKFLVSGVGDARNEKGAKATINRLIGTFPGVSQDAS